MPFQVIEVESDELGKLIGNRNIPYGLLVLRHREQIFFVQPCLHADGFRADIVMKLR